MERERVSSSNLASIGYDEISNTLEIEFNNGNIYQYYQVPHAIFLDLMRASSHGTYFDRNIKKGGYSYTKIG